jgi:hypothetical protein
MRLELESFSRSFETITMAQLDEGAQLQTRTDLKYVVDAAVLRRLGGALAAEYRVLELEGRRLFHYDSVYFDSPDLVTYRQHHQGRRRRFKCRTRLYADSGLCFFEVKLKDGRGRTVKRKLALDRAEHGRLRTETRAFLADQLRRAYGHAAPDELEPVLGTSYRRLTLACPERRERVTCDVELVFSAVDGRSYGVRPGRLLVETKSARGNGLADRLLRRAGAAPVASCSKYCLGIALAHPAVVNNRFRPLLRRHFDAAAAGHLAA